MSVLADPIEPDVRDIVVAALRASIAACHQAGLIACDYAIVDDANEKAIRALVRLGEQP